MNDNTTETPLAPPPRPEVDHMVGLFPRFGIIPHSKCFLLAHTVMSSQNCGCVVGAMLAEATGSVSAALKIKYKSGVPHRTLATLTGLPPAYTAGLSDGFSAFERLNPNDPVTAAEMHAGWADGRAVRDRVLPLQEQS